MGHFCCAFFQFSGFIWTWKCFGLWLDLDWVVKNQDWIWIAKYDSPLIFGLQIVAWQHQKSIFALYLLPCSTVASRYGRGVLAARRLGITAVVCLCLLSPVKPYFGWHITGHNSPPNKDRELFKSLEDAENLVVSIFF